MHDKNLETKTNLKNYNTIYMVRGKEEAKINKLGNIANKRSNTGASLCLLLMFGRSDGLKNEVSHQRQTHLDNFTFFIVQRITSAHVRQVSTKSSANFTNIPIVTR